MGATCFAPGLIHGFVAFAASWPVQSGSRSLLGVTSDRCDLLCAKTSIMYLLLLLLLGQCKAGRARFLGVTSDRCDLLCAKRVALIPLVGKFPQVSLDSLGCWAEI